ncbi:MAG: cell wall hydrolase [Acholeplasmataceae bacterium]|nr:cell wall hydrolase [Acholeplasmataceae bacterium]HOA63370.1 cell wall hydrolase [Bacilli bacterium]HPT89057.1 cell wall hydrolase [Bacilli bacterium]HQA19208.1 cell wall hydrolase [Bacilli bacterium]HQD91634.1 cell wall hydrolase [Bacilli bacterium]
MAVVAHNEEEVKLLARLMRAEAEGEGQLGMLMVGNVGINRVLANCLDFYDIRTITQMVFQRPGGFESTLYPYFYQAARQVDIRLARRVINGEKFYPADRALWFYATDGDCVAQWFGQWNSGRFKSHCFYAPVESEQCFI